MKKRLVALAALALFNLSGSPAWAGKLEQIKKDGLRVCTEPAYMPFEMTDKRGQIIGFDPDLAALMAKELGAAKLDLISTAWDGIIPALITNKCDIIMSGMTITDERKEKISFADPYMLIGQTVLVRKDLAEKVKSYRDLNKPDYKIASKLGTTGEIAAKKYIPKAKYFSYETEAEAVMETVNGKVDAFIYDAPYNLVANAQRGEGKLVFLDKPFTDEPIGWAIAKGDPEFLEAINGFLAKIKKEGAHEKLHQKWFKNTDWLKDVQ
ncbi:MAG: transporter substrate-binding domain-containing protein [Candidatus Competibacteraceae bacterium]|nr:transporter substrate-binding domain-containing protein [Candidatus Competibacteraceae bacterium]MBK7983200.1 transporter substrate-binding domain-containing protein [Candidatus Competibacteraceae bacterium]MBK8898252.1 transporter substrate-binding domain-containing protein [Candidatus Competibacteraceae bacterium]MBK8962059.1 transporter substrate-binding domain-containing protein [Candidatus Competibacteraceae bacterium]MBK9951273.1 transporter substrate-binding domain-containing protein 